MKKLLSILTITTLTASVPAPLLANTPLTRVKRDVGTTAKDVTTGFDIKIKEKYNNWKLIPRINDVLIPPAEIAHTDNTRYYVKEDDRKYIVIYGDKIQKWKINSETAKEINNKWAWGSRVKIYYWDGVGEPNLPEINKNNGNITNWNIDKTPFQQGISFALAENDKTATWSNAGMRLTVDGETNININNPNVTEVLWNGVKQKMLDHKVDINVKPETSEKTHKLVIKYDINGTQNTRVKILM